MTGPREYIYRQLHAIRRADPAKQAKGEHVYIPRKMYVAFKRSLEPDLMYSDAAYIDRSGIHDLDAIQFCGAYIHPLDWESESEDA
jgi:hypothetical protein